MPPSSRPLLRIVGATLSWVGRSYGGAVITEASRPAKVSRLVYVDAFMPDSGRTFASYLLPGPPPDEVEEAREVGSARTGVGIQDVVDVHLVDSPPSSSAN